MTLYAAILALIWPWAFPGGGPGAMIPESMASYESRLGTIARAWADVTTDPAIAAAGVALWRAESRFRLDVHAGTRKGDHGRATCLGSVHPWAKDWATLAGVDLEATERCARATMQALRSGYVMCGHTWAYAYEYYAVGHCSEPGEESRRRARTQAYLEYQIKKSMGVRKELDGIGE